MFKLVYCGEQRRGVVSRRYREDVKDNKCTIKVKARVFSNVVQVYTGGSNLKIAAVVRAIMVRPQQGRERFGLKGLTLGLWGGA